jgi:hypothetical protein
LYAKQSPEIYGREGRGGAAIKPPLNSTRIQYTVLKATVLGFQLSWLLVGFRPFKR